LPALNHVPDGLTTGGAGKQLGEGLSAYHSVQQIPTDSKKLTFDEEYEKSWQALRGYNQGYSKEHSERLRKEKFEELGKVSIPEKTPIRARVDYRPEPKEEAILPTYPTKNDVDFQLADLNTR
jgi:hypothetical protein